MGLVEILVNQSGKPSGILGRIMIKIMNRMDVGLNKWIVDKVDCPRGCALDIGCGGGETLFRLLEENKLKHIIGIDYSIDSVKVAKNKNKHFIEKGRAEILQGNITRLPYSQNYFDIILAVRTHYFWDDFKTAFSEIYRTLKPDGIMYVFSEIYKIQYHMKEYNTDVTMICFLQSIGFKNVQIENRGTVQCITAYK